VFCGVCAGFVSSARLFVCVVCLRVLLGVCGVCLCVEGVLAVVWWMSCWLCVWILWLRWVVFVCGLDLCSCLRRCVGLACGRLLSRFCTLFVRWLFRVWLSDGSGCLLVVVWLEVWVDWMVGCG